MKSNQWLQVLYLFFFSVTMISCSTFSTGRSGTSSPPADPTAHETSTATVLPTLTFTPTPAAFNGERAFRDVENRSHSDPDYQKARPMHRLANGSSKNWVTLVG